jgi:hypothetical protein
MTDKYPQSEPSAICFPLVDYDRETISKDQRYHGFVAVTVPWDQLEVEELRQQGN